MLYNHFHGKMTDRMTVLTEKISNLELMEELKINDVIETFHTLQSRNRRLDRKLKNLDKDLITGQISFDLKTEQP